MRPEKSAGGCGTFGYYMKNILKFLLSHIGLVSLVVGYTIIGAFTFERLEAEEELKVKKNVTATRLKVTDDLWDITEESDVFKEHVWAEKVRERLQEFEMELIKAMKNRGWDGNEETSTQQWTFAGALFYSIILITTIGYGHIAPKTTWGKVVTIFYAIPGVPLMMLCLANIGDGMAQSFRFLYWKVCCYACTKKPKRKLRYKNTRISRASRYPSSGHSSQRGQRSSSYRRSARTSQRSADSHMSDSAFYSNYDNEYRVQEDNVDPAMDPRGGGIMKGRAMEDSARRSIRRGGSDPTANTRSSQRSTRSGDHLEIPNTEEPQDEGRAAVLYNKYALEKEGMTPDDLPPVHNFRRSPNRGADPIGDYRLEHRSDPNLEPRDTRLKEPEILVTRAPKSAPGSLREPPPKPVYPDSPSTSHRGDLYARNVPPPGDPRDPRDPRNRLSRLEEEYYYDDYYDDEEDDDYDNDENVVRPVPIWLGVMLVVTYIFGGAFLFSEWEGWNFLDSVYFCFITLTTIGFGDYVPAQEKKKNAELSIALCSIYLLFGIALLAMSFNLVQEEVISKVKKVAKRLGIIKEEGEDEEEE